MLFAVGDRVRRDGIKAEGTIERDDGYNVRVRWDDGQIGDLIYDPSVFYDAHYLVKIETN